VATRPAGRRLARAQREVLSVVRVEDVHRGHVGPQLGALTFLDPGGRVQPRGHGLGGAQLCRTGIRGQVSQLVGLRGQPALLGEVDEYVRAHRLDYVNGGPELNALGLIGGLDQGRVLEVLGADAHDDLTARVAAFQGLAQLWRQRQPANRRGHAALLQRARHEVHGRRADEAGHEQVDRVRVQLVRRADLLQEPAAHDREPVAQGHRLGLVVGDVHHRGAEPLLQLGHLGAGLHPQLGVQVGERLVHQEDRGIADDGPAHGDPLPLAAGQVGRAPLQVLGQVQHPRGLVDLLVDGRLRGLGQLEREAHVLPHGHVRVQGVALEHHGDVAVLRRGVVDHLAADPQLAVGDVLQPGDHVERGGLPAARRPDQDHELAVGDIQADLVDRQRPVRESLGHVVESDFSHCVAPWVLS
jgi:hypothetical protein